MHTFHECGANAAECQRMADRATDPAERQLWNEMATHWRYISPPLPVSGVFPRAAG